MASASRRSRRTGIDIWPGFVDALSQLLMVIIFILLVFTAGQFYLSNALNGSDQALQRLQSQLNALTDLLSVERHANDELRRGAADLATELKNSLAVRDALTTRVAALGEEAQAESARADQAVAKLADTKTTVTDDKATVELQLQQLAALRADIAALQTVRASLEAKVAALVAAQQQTVADESTLRDQAKTLAAELATAQGEDTAKDTQLRTLSTRATTAEQKLASEKAISANALAQIELLNAQLVTLHAQLDRITAALDIATAKVKEQKGEIVALGQKLNMALVNKVEELSQYRSQFFGELRKIIGDHPGIHIVGDRFVFQSEVLFKPGSADLDDAAKTELAPVFATLKTIAAKIPQSLPWILRVDGYTDKRPISTPQFASNWELSSARAIAVVQYAISQGVPADHLAAAGFADTHPIDTGTTPEAYRRNRRIELKLTEP